MDGSNIKNIFKNEKIEYFAALDYNDCREINPHIIKRTGILPKSVLVYLIPYYGGETVNLSRYAAAQDYHVFIRRFNASLIEKLKTVFPKAKMCDFGDHSPIDERHAALIGGLGILGDNRLIINEKYGSYVFIAEIITDIPPEDIGAIEPLTIKKCESCGACKNLCWGGILDGRGVCLSAITQKKGELTPEEKELILRSGYVWGCDACQTCCPHNRSPLITPFEFFLNGRIEKLDSSVIEKMSEEEFSARAFGWRGYKTLKRNIDLLGL